jgi:hypothetical protein
MSDIKPPLGWLFGLAKGAVDLWRLPGRVKRLAETAAAQNDPRPFCPTCGTGRIRAENTFLDGYNYAAIGPCEGCGAVWVYWVDSNSVSRLAEPADARHRKSG